MHGTLSPSYPQLRDVFDSFVLANRRRAGIHPVLDKEKHSLKWKFFLCHLKQKNVLDSVEIKNNKMRAPPFVLIRI